MSRQGQDSQDDPSEERAEIHTDPMAGIHARMDDLAAMIRDIMVSRQQPVVSAPPAVGMTSQEAVGLSTQGTVGLSAQGTVGLSTPGTVGPSAQGAVGPSVQGLGTVQNSGGQFSTTALVATHQDAGAEPLPIQIPLESEGIIVPSISAREEEMAKKLHALQSTVQNMQGLSMYGNINFSQLCFYPEHPLPAKFKVPDFSQFNGTGDPIAHLRLYAGALCGYSHDDKLCMQLFQRSLKGPALQWFARLNIQEIRTWHDLSNLFVEQYRHNCELVVDRCTLMEMGQKPTETFREYAIRWRDLASQVHPPLTSTEHSRLFIGTLKGVLFSQLCASIGQNFPHLIVQGEAVENALRHGKLESVSAPGESSRKPLGRKVEKREPQVAAILPVQG